MKQAIKKVESPKALSHEATLVNKPEKTNQVEKARLVEVKKNDDFNRFLEANCDCV